MAGLPTPESTVPRQSAIATRNARIGMFLFAIYLALYGGFMGLSAFSPDIMGKRPLFGVNLAILYGIGLIVAAWFLAFLYMYLCRRRPGEVEDGR